MTRRSHAAQSVENVTPTVQRTIRSSADALPVTRPLEALENGAPDHLLARETLLLAEGIQGAFKVGVSPEREGHTGTIPV